MRYAHAKRRGFTLVEVLVVVFIIALLASLAATWFGPWVTYEQKRGSERKLQAIKSAMLLAYRENAVPMESVATARFLIDGTSIPNNTTATTGAAGTFLPLARYAQLSADQMAIDGFNVPVTVFVSNRLSRVVQGHTLFYRAAAIVSNGPNAVREAGTTFDVATGQLVIAGDDVGVTLDGYEVQRELFDRSFKQLTRIADAYQSYFQARYLTDPARDISINYFASTDPTGAASTRWDSGGTFASSLGAFANLSTLNAEASLGVGPQDLLDAWGGNIQVDNSSALMRHPSNATVAMRTPPYSARIASTLPGGGTLTVTVNSLF